MNGLPKAARRRSAVSLIAVIGVTASFVFPLAAEGAKQPPPPPTSCTAASTKQMPTASCEFTALSSTVTYRARIHAGGSATIEVLAGPLCQTEKAGTTAIQLTSSASGSVAGVSPTDCVVLGISSGRITASS